MGRRKINIQRIDNDRKRTVTFNKRKVGLIKKAIELSVLCDCEIAMVILKGGKVYQYASSDLEKILSVHRSYEGPIESLSNDAHEMLKPGRSLPRRPEFLQSKKRTEPSTPVPDISVPKMARSVAGHLLMNQQQQQQQQQLQQPQQQQTHARTPTAVLDVTSSLASSNDFISSTASTAAAAARDSASTFPNMFGFWTPDINPNMTGSSDRFFIPDDDESLRHTFDSVTRNVSIRPKKEPEGISEAPGNGSVPPVTAAANAPCGSGGAPAVHLMNNGTAAPPSH